MGCRTSPPRFQSNELTNQKFDSNSKLNLAYGQHYDVKPITFSISNRFYRTQNNVGPLNDQIITEWVVTMVPGVPNTDILQWPVTSQRLSWRRLWLWHICHTRLHQINPMALWYKRVATPVVRSGNMSRCKRNSVQKRARIYELCHRHHSLVSTVVCVFNCWMVPIGMTHHGNQVCLFFYCEVDTAFHVAFTSKSMTQIYTCGQINTI